MATKNDITGDSLVSRTSEAYRNNYDLIFGKKKGNNNEQRTRLHDGELGSESKAGDTEGVSEPADYPHDRTNRDSEH